jgi:hypothetical protein
VKGAPLKRFLGALLSSSLAVSSSLVMVHAARAATGTCGIPAIPVASSDVASGTFNASATELGGCISGESRQLSEGHGANVFDVRRYGARCNGEGDDAEAIQRAERAAVASNAHATVFVPPGRCVVSHGIAWDSNVDLYGAGMFRSVIAASSDFGFSPETVRKGPNGQYVGMLWLDGPSETAPLVNVTVSDLGFDPRSGTQGRKYGEFNFEPIAGYLRALQHVRFNDLYFDLGYNTTPYFGVSLGPKGFFGIKVIAADCDHESTDISFTNVVGYNGDGTIQFGPGDSLQRCASPTTVSNVRIDGEVDFVDGQNIDDDRIILAGSNVRPSLFTGISIVNVQTYVFDRATGGVNSVTISPGTVGVIRDVTIGGIRYRGPTVPHFGYPRKDTTYVNGTGAVVSVLGSRDGGANGVTIRDVVGRNSYGIQANVKSGGPLGTFESLDVESVQLLHCYASGYAALGIQVWSPPSGGDMLKVAGVTITAAPELRTFAAQHGTHGLVLQPHAAGDGASGSLQVSDLSISGLPVPVFVPKRDAFPGLQIP